MSDVANVPLRRSVGPAPFGWLRTEIDRLFDDLTPARSIFNFSPNGVAPIPRLR